MPVRVPFPVVDEVSRHCHQDAEPETVHVDHLLKLEKFSHVIHLTSQVSGLLREGKNRCVFSGNTPSVLRF